MAQPLVSPSPGVFRARVQPCTIPDAVPWGAAPRQHTLHLQQGLAMPVQHPSTARPLQHKSPAPLFLSLIPKTLHVAGNQSLLTGSQRRLQPLVRFTTCWCFSFGDHQRCPEPAVPSGVTLRWRSAGSFGAAPPKSCCQWAELAAAQWHGGGGLASTITGCSQPPSLWGGQWLSCVISGHLRSTWLPGPWPAQPGHPPGMFLGCCGARRQPSLCLRPRRCVCASPARGAQGRVACPLNGLQQ